MSRRLQIVFAVFLLLSAACGRGVGTSMGQGTAAETGTGNAERAAAAEGGDTPGRPSTRTHAAPMRPLAAAAPCDGAAVLCVAVGGDGTGTAAAPYGLIQDAVDAAGPGTVIQVALGEYAENVVMRPGIALRGGFSDDFEDRPADAVSLIVGQGGGPTVLIDVIDDVEVEGFSVTGGTGVCFDAVCDGGGIAATGSGLLIAHNRLFDNTLTLERDSNGAGLSVEGDAEIVDNVIEGNTGGNGAGMIGAGELRIVGNVIRGNESVGDHGGGAFLTGHITLEDNLFEANRVGETLGYGWAGGSIIATEGSTFTARGNVYRGNFAVSAGAGAFVDDGADGVMTNELIVGNECMPGDARGALYVDALDASGDTGSVVEVTNVTIADNTCGYGIAVENAGSAATVRNSIIVNNVGAALEPVGEGTASASYTLADEPLPGTGNLTGDPAFAGGGDYHLRSAGGRFDPASGAFVVDSETSPAIDAGDPADPVGEETEPNGDRINLGAYGGTPEASRNATAPPPPPPPPGAEARIVGADGDLVSTAVAVSTSRFDDGAAVHAVVSRDDVFADSLGGSALTRDGPLLFTAPATLDDRTRAELARVLPRGGTVYLLGGTAALSDDVAAAIAADGYDVQRLAGDSRVETSTAVARTARALAPDGDEVLLARAFGPPEDPNGTAAWADSVTGGGYAAATTTPVLLTATDALHPAVADYLAEDDPTSTILLGGTAALSDAVEGAVPAPRRVAGANRAATAAAIAEQLLGVAPAGERAYLITDGTHPQGWGYGLAAAGLVAGRDAPLLLTAGTTVPPETLATVTSCADEPVTLTAVGGTDLVPDDVLAQLDAADDDPC